MSALQSFHLGGAVQNGESNVICVKPAYFWIVCPYARNLAEAPKTQHLERSAGSTGFIEI